MDENQALALLHAARQVAEKAYAPYSGFPVGAALLTADDQIILGVNVENASYGLTLCAERAAIATAIAQGKRQFKAIAVWASQRPHGTITPCGACRQVLAEFLKSDCLVVSADEQTGHPKQLTMKALLPEAFDLAIDPDDNFPDTDNNKPGG